MNLPEWKPSAWIARCAQRLCSGGSTLDPADAADVATALWDRERWRGDPPESAAERHLQSEAALAEIRRLAGPMRALRHG